MTLRTDYADGGATPATGNITASDMNAISAEVNSNTTDKASLTGTETLTNKTLTAPKFNQLKDTNGNIILDTIPTASAVNYVQIRNNVDGGLVGFSAAGTSGDIPLALNAKGNGAVIFGVGGSDGLFQIDGAAPDINFHLIPKGTGKVTANGVEMLTISGIQTMTNKTIPLSGNGLTGTTAQFNTALSDGDFATLAGTETLTGKTVTALSTTDGIANVNLPNGITNANTARQSQATSANTNYYITSSNLNLPATLKAGMAVGTRFTWRVYMDKTAAGTGTFGIVIYRGTNGTTADTADVTQTIGTQTAIVDSMVVDVSVVVTTTGATGAYYWTICPMQRAATATGFGVPTGTTGLYSGTVSSVAMNTASLKFGLAFRNGAGSGPTVSVPMVQAQAFNIC